MPTINDIAKEAGVSHGTVSNVLNKTGKVSIEKIQLVENAIKKLGYVPNVQAQRLRQGSPNTIAVILPSLKEAKYIDFFTALQLNFPKSQKSLLVYQTEDIPAEEEVILDNLRASGLAALIVISTLSKECLEKYRSLHCPIVFVERRPRTLRTDEWFLSFDPQKIGAAVTAFCAQKHWRSIAYFGVERHGEAENPIFSSLQKCAQAQGLALAHIPSGYKLALNQAFELAQNAAPYDVILTQSSVCTDALLRAFRLLHIEKIPPILTIGACTALPEKAVELYHLDYGFLGIRIIKLFSKLDRDSASAEKELFYAPKGFADSFPGLQRMPDTQLTMLTLENPSTQALCKLLPEFEHRSGIRIKLIGVPYDDLLAQLNLIGPHFTYDMIRIDVAQFGDIGQSIYRPLDELSISPEGLSPRLIKNGYDSYSMLNGRVYALPLDPSVQIFLYRTDLFHDAKLCRAYYERFHENLGGAHHLRAVSPRCGVLHPQLQPGLPHRVRHHHDLRLCLRCSKRFSALLPFPHRPLRLYAGDPPAGLPRNAGGHAPVPCTGKVLLQAELVGRQHPEICGGKDRHDRHLLQLCSRTDQLRKFGGRRSGGRGHPSGMQASAGRRHRGHLPIQPKSGSLQAVLPLVLLCGCGFPAGSSGRHFPHCGCL